MSSDPTMEPAMLDLPIDDAPPVVPAPSSMPTLRLYMESLLTPFKVSQIKTDREYEEIRKALEAGYLARRKAKVQEQHKAFQALLERQRIELDEVKAGTMLPKRVVVMGETVRNLRLQRAHKAADEMERVRARLEDKFWRETLGTRGGVIHKMDAEQRKFRDQQELELSEMAVDMEKRRKEWAAKRVMAVQRSRQGVPRKGDHPFSIWYYAAKGEMEPLVKVLSKHPDRLNHQDPDTGHTPLHYAAKNGHVELVKMLLQKGANVDVRDGQGNTVLHLSAGWGNVKTTALLLEAGADPRGKNLDGKMARDIAADKAMAKTLDFLDRWTPMGVSLEEREKVAEPEPDPFEQEPDPSIRQQLRVLEMRQSRHSPSDPSLLPTLKKLVQLYRKHHPGRRSSTIETLQRYLSVAEKAHGKWCLQVAWSCNELGEVLHAGADNEVQDNRSQAGDGGAGASSLEYDDDGGNEQQVADYFQRAIHALERVQGPTSPDLDVPLRNLALHYLSRSMVYEAEPVLQRLADMQEARQTTEMGSVAEDLIPTIDLLGYTVLLKRDFARARSLYERSLEIAKQYYDDKDLRLAPRVENLAMVAFCEGDDQGAEKGFCHAHDLLVRGGLDPFGPAVLRLATNVGVTVCRASARKF